MLRILFISLLVIGVMFSACTSQTAAPSSTWISLPHPTNTVSLTKTILPLPSRTLLTTTQPELLTVTPVAIFRLPAKKVVSEWKNIPVMPNAFAGEETDDAKSYTFAVKGNISFVQNFYTSQLIRLGWALIAVGEGENADRLLTFIKGEDALTISIILADETERIMRVTLSIDGK